MNMVNRVILVILVKLVILVNDDSDKYEYIFANWFKIWSSGDVTCIAWFQSWQPGCVTCIATLPWNVLLALSVSIGLVSLSARVLSVKSAEGL